MVPDLLATIIIALGALGVTFAMLYGYRVRNHMVTETDDPKLHYKMMLLGLVIAGVSWGVAWQSVGVVAMMLHFWWVGLIPFSIVYGYEVVAESSSIGDVFLSWLLGTLFLAPPGLGQIVLVILVPFCLVEILKKEKPLPSITEGMTTY